MNEKENQILKNLYQVIKDRKLNPQEGSYTAYLFESGLDKILKKVGEESAETIIAAKNGDKQEVIEEISDLMYHLLVMLHQLNIDIGEVEENLEKRSLKTKNLKASKVVDKNT